MTSLHQLPLQASATDATSSIGPHCLTCGATESASSPVQDNTESIQREIQRIDNQIYQLHKQRAFLVHRTNMVRSPTRVLPTEVLSAIFKWNIFSSWKRYQPTIQISSVCSRWRQIVLSTPELWTVLQLSIYPRYIAKNVAIARMSLRNSRNRPLSLEFTFIGDSEPYDFQPITDLIFGPESRGRIRAIYFGYMVPPAWLPFFSKEFPTLELLGIGSINTQHPSNITAISLAGMPLLRRLYIDSSRLPVPITISPTMKSVTILTLKHVDVNSWEKLIVECPNLIECHCGTICPGDVNLDSTISTITLPRLKVLLWPVTVGYSTLLRHLRLPALQTLRLRERGLAEPSEDRMDCLIEFIKHLPMTIKDIQLHSFRHKEVLARLFSRAHKAEKLFILESPGDFIREAVQILAQGLSSGDSAAADLVAEYLPCLQVLSIAGRSNEYLELLPEMVRGRDRIGSPLILQVGVTTDRQGLGWYVPEDVEDAIEELAEEGHSAKYIVDLSREQWEECYYC